MELQKDERQQRDKELLALREQQRQLLRANGYYWQNVTRREQDDEWRGEVTWQEWVLFTRDGRETSLTTALNAIAVSSDISGASPIPLASSVSAAKLVHSNPPNVEHIAPIFPIMLPNVPLPTLVGTERQVSWAQSIRARQLRHIRSNLDTLSGQFDTISDFRLRLAHLHCLPQAHWWIQHRDDAPDALLRSIKLQTMRFDIKRPYAHTREEAEQLAVQLSHGPTLILDMETTGLGSDDVPVEIAIMREDGTVVLDTLVNPERSIPLDATEIHGITDKMVAEAPTFRELWPFICMHLRTSRYLAIYNAQFDMSIIRRLAAKLIAQDRTMPPCPYREADDVLHQYAAYRANAKRMISLTAACQEAGISIEAHHRSLTDCNATLALIRHMAKSERGEAMPF